MTTDQSTEPVAGRAEDQLRNDIKALLNRHSAENGSNTPDHILARYLMDCLHAYDVAVCARADWYGHMDQPGGAAVRRYEGDHPVNRDPDWYIAQQAQDRMFHQGQS